MPRVLGAGTLLFYAAAFVLGVAVGSIVRAVKGHGTRSFTTGLEAGLLAAIGAFLSASVVAWLLSASGDSDGAAILLGFALFLWVGAIDLVAYLVRGDLWVGAEHMVWVALAVGGCAGLFAGVHRVYDWKGLTYYDNPWEVWAYRFGGARSHPSALMCWPALAALVAAVIFYPLAAVLCVWLVRMAWFT